MIHLLMMTMLLTFSDTRPRSAAIVDIDTCRYRVTLEPRLDLQRDDVVVLHEACGDGDVVITKVDTTIGSTVCLRTTNLTRVSLHHCAHLTLAATAQETPAIRPFNGRYGGLLALVNDTIRRDTIDLSGYGWSGGEPSLPDVSVHDRFVHRDTIYLGGDGRGHDTLSGGRGGRPRNAGGGGGAGAAGNGGSGGHQTTCFEAGISGGRGGIVDGRGILFGSGGGEVTLTIMLMLVVDVEEELSSSILACLMYRVLTSPERVHRTFVMMVPEVVVVADVLSFSPIRC